MGQRSQIYVRVTSEDGIKGLMPRYYSWNYGTRMVSRARHTIEWLMSHYNPTACVTRIDSFIQNEDSIKLERVMDTNFDYQDVVLGSNLIDEYLEYARGYDFNNEVFFGQGNNDGKLFIDITVTEEKVWEKPEVKASYAFFARGDEYCKKPLTAAQYLKDYDISSDEVEFNLDNMNWLEENATLMTKEEAQEFVSYDYAKAMGLAGMVSKEEKTYEVIQERHLREDAENQARAYLEEIEDDPAKRSEAEKISMFSFSTYSELARRFLKQKDMNVADNDTWRSVIKDYLAA